MYATLADYEKHQMILTTYCIRYKGLKSNEKRWCVCAYVVYSTTKYKFTIDQQAFVRFKNFFWFKWHGPKKLVRFIFFILFLFVMERVRANSLFAK